MGGGGVFQKPNVGNLGVGIRPSDNMTGLSINTTTTKTPPSLPGMSQNVIDSGEIYSSADITQLQLEYDTDEALRQDKLDRMSQLAQGKGGGTQAPRPPGQGQPGQFQVQSTPMVNLKRRFPSLEQTEGSLNPFLGRRYNK